MDKKNILTYEGLKKLEDELENLRSVKRQEVAERIKVAISYGDISENSEYDDAKFLDYAEDSKLQNVLISIEMEDYGDYDEQEVDDCLKVLKHDAPLEEQIARISTQLDQAKRQNDVNKITELTIKYIKMMQEKQADA